MSIFIPPYKGFPRWQGLDRCTPDKYSGLPEEERKKLDEEIDRAMNGELDMFDPWSDLWEDK